MSSGPSSPSLLVARIQRNDSAAKAELVERFGRGLNLMLRRLCRDPAQAEDVVQETLSLVIEKIRSGELRQPESLAELSRRAATASRPRADVALVPLTSVRGSGDAPVYPVPLPREPAPVGLWVELGDAGVPAYRATLLGPDGGVVWRGENLELNRLGALLLTFPPGFLSPGEYALRIEGLPATGEPLPVARFRLSVSRAGA